MAAIVIVGAGHAAGQAAASLRQDGWEDDIIIFGDEDHIPYQRPPLSKQYLAGEQGLDKVYLRPAKFYADKNVTVRTGVRVESINPEAHTVTVSGGETVEYTKLLLATGSRPRLLNIPGADLKGLHYLRTIADVDAIRAELAPGKKVVIVGGGYIGLEVAAVCQTLGLEAHIVEMEERILARVTTPTMSAYYHELHTGRGVHIHTRHLVTAIEGEGRVTAVLTDSDRYEADLVVIGIGIVPNIELAANAGIACANGITVNERCETSAVDVYAAGDCTNHPNPLLNRRLRLESVPNAMEQARVAAANMTGSDKKYASVPWFWSDQYELKLQMVGFSADGDQQVVRGSMAENKFAVFYLKAGAVVAADAVNSPKEFMACKQMIGKSVDVRALADPATDLKSLLA